MTDQERVRAELDAMYTSLRKLLRTGGLPDQEFGELYYILSTMEAMCFRKGNNTGSPAYNVLDFKKWLETLIEERKLRMTHSYDIERIESYLKVCLMVLDKLKIVLRIDPGLAAPKRFLVVHLD